MFFTACYFEDKPEGQTRRPNNINKKPHRKVTKLKSKFLLILG